jgi:hypothetical protein
MTVLLSGWRVNENGLSYTSDADSPMVACARGLGGRLRLKLAADL